MRNPLGESSNSVVIYTAESCIGNPGTGAYAAVILQEGGSRLELSEGHRRTTNNRLELMGPIKALESLTQKSQVTLHSGSQYVVDSIGKGWAKRWRESEWMRNRKERAANSDLWARLLDQCEQHTVEFKWSRDKSDDPEQERCGLLAWRAAREESLQVDDAYEAVASGKDSGGGKDSGSPKLL